MPAFVGSKLGTLQQPAQLLPNKSKFHQHYGDRLEVGSQMKIMALPSDGTSHDKRRKNINSYSNYSSEAYD